MDDSWMLPAEAIEYIVGNCAENVTVLEFGSGHGSQVLADNVNLYSIEHDESWIDVTSSNYIFAPITENPFSNKYGQNGWYDVGVVEDNWPSRVGFVVIDGPPGAIGRFGILSILDLLQHVPTILVDDVDRSDEHLLAKYLAETLSMSLTIYNVAKPRKSATERKFAVLIKED